MEQLKTGILENGLNEIANNKNSLDSILKQNRIFFDLKKNSLIQKVLINTLLIRNNCFIDDLANLLHTDAKKLHQVWQGKGTLTGKKSHQLISLFYILTN